MNDDWLYEAALAHSRQQLYERLSKSTIRMCPAIVPAPKPGWFHAVIGDVGARVRVLTWMQIPP